MTRNLQPTLEDPLILLRPLRTDDFEALFRVAKDPLIWEQHPANDRYKPDVFATFFRDALDSKGAFAVIDKATGIMIGSSRFKVVEDAPSAVEIGWTFLAREYWGGTYNAAMKKLMIGYAFTLFDEVIFRIGITNMRSRKAVEKIGGKLITDNYPHLLRDTKDVVTYRIKREN